MEKPGPFEQILQEIQNASETANCARCGIDLNHLKIGSKDYYCEPCIKILHAIRLSQSHAPNYDIDKILESDSTFDIIQSLASVSEFDSEHQPIPWSSLLPPEAVCRAYLHFDGLMGNGFASLLEYGGGPEIFIRGHYALESVGAAALLKVTRAAKLIMETHGISFPEDVPQDWWDQEDGIDFDQYPEMDSELEELDSSYWRVGSKDAQLLIVQYIRSNIDILRTRKLPGA